MKLKCVWQVKKYTANNCGESSCFIRLLYYSATWYEGF